jgi:hypothetical protein
LFNHILFLSVIEGRRLAYLFWILGVIVLLVRDEYFILLGISSGGKTLLFFLLLILGVISHRRKAARAFRAMIHPIDTLEKGLQKGGYIDKGKDSDLKR